MLQYTLSHAFNSHHAPQLHYRILHRLLLIYMICATYWRWITDECVKHTNTNRSKKKKSSVV